MFLDRNLPLSATSQTDDDDNSDEDEDKRTIFCANLHERVTEEILCELFIQGGPIESVRIPTDKDGRSRNFGFITYIHSCSVRYALQLFDGVRLFNRPLTMRFNGNNKSNNNNSNHHQQQHFYEHLQRFSRIPSSAPKSQTENSSSSAPRSHKDNDKKTPKKLPFENNSSALRLGGASSSRSHIRFDLNMQPKEKSCSEKSKNPFKIDLDVLSRLSSNLLPPKRSQESHKNRSSGNNTNNRNDKNLNSKDRHRVHGNRERDKLHPYKRPDIHIDNQKDFGRNHLSSNERNGRNRGNNRRR